MSEKRSRSRVTDDEDGDSRQKKRHDADRDEPDEERRKQNRDDGRGDDGNREEDDDEAIGPSFTEFSQVTEKKKKKKVIPFEDVYINNLPSCEFYERSYMHREMITHLVVTKKTDFLITGSFDGAVKFWKKQRLGIEFVKHFRTHLGPIEDLAANTTGTLLATCCAAEKDTSLKVFDVINFDMINIIQLSHSDPEFKPKRCEWIHGPDDTVSWIAISDQSRAVILIFDGKGDAKQPPLHRIEDSFHRAPVICMKFNPPYSTIVSADSNGILDYWMNPKNDYKFPDFLKFESKLDTDLYEFAKTKAVVHNMDFSPDGDLFAVISNDRKIRIFRFLTGKLARVFDETLSNLTSLQQMKGLLPNMEFGKRMAVERDLEKQPELWKHEEIKFDSSGYFIVYPTMLGIKIINWYSNKMVKMLGKSENIRPLKVALFQNLVKSKRTVEAEAANNPLIEALAANPDPTIFCSAFRKNRFYIFSRRHPDEAAETGEGGVGKVTSIADRDIFNEKPTREDIIAATETLAQQNLHEQVIIHTTMGDIHCKLFVRECPKTVENFCVHSRNGYYNGHIFHRVIKQFMIQTGDPTGTGSGGESIWGGEFEDEFHPDLKHDKPYTLSMANAGPNTNGSQFFITVIPCPWLDRKHTVFGRVTRGMEVVQNISNAKTNPKTDKPYDDIKVINVSLK